LTRLVVYYFIIYSKISIYVKVIVYIIIKTLIYNFTKVRIKIK